MMFPTILDVDDGLSGEQQNPWSSRSHNVTVVASIPITVEYIPSTSAPGIVDKLKTC